MFFLTMSDPSSVDGKSRVVQYPKRQPLDHLSRKEGLEHVSVSERECLWPSADGGVCLSQHFTLGVPKDMTRGKSSRVFFQLCNGF